MYSNSGRSNSALESHFLGLESLASKDFVGAEKRIRDALAVNENLSSAWSDLGIAVFRQGRHQEALEYFRKAVDIDSGFAKGWSNLGSALIECGLINDAIIVCRTSVLLNPNLYEARKNLAFALSLTGSHKEAALQMLEAAEKNPAKSEIWLEAGDACREAGMISKAAVCYRRSLVLEPASTAVLVRQSYLLLGMLEQDKSEKLINKLLTLVPDDPVVHSDALMSLQYFPNATNSQMFSEAVRWGTRYGARIPRHVLTVPDTDRKLRIGYVSADLCKHPVGIFLMPILRHRNSSAFSVVCYSNSLREDDVTAEIKSLVDDWRVISGKSDREVTEMISHDQIDILVDLSGHSAGNRLTLFAGRAAPVQLSFLGYSQTTGLKAMDYLLSDNYTLHPSEEQWFTEQVVFLPNGRFCYEAPDFVPEVEQLPAVENGYITFGCFNNPAKINAAVIGIWSQILLKVPDSRLILKWKSFANSKGRKRFSKLFADNGVASSQIEFRESSPHFLMMAEYGEIDIALDPFPFTGGLTTCEALWMGVPVITLPGDTPISRQTASFLKQTNLEDFIANSPYEYVSIAVKAAENINRLAAMRRGMRDRMLSSSLCNGKEYTAHLESAYANMFKEYCSGKIDESISDAEIASAFESAGLLFVKKQYDMSEDIYHDILQWRPENPRALHAIGMISEKRGNRDVGIEYLKRAIEQKPDYPEAHLNLGNMLRHEDRLSEAEQSFKLVVDINPDNPPALASLGGTLWAQGRIDEAIQYFRQSLAVCPGYDVAATGLLLAMNYSPNVTPEEIFSAHANWGRDLEKKAKKYSHYINTRDENRAIRIGYVSGDLGVHPVGFFIINPIRSHTRNKIQVICYSNRTGDDDLTRYLQEQSDGWREIHGCSDDDVCRMIRKDKIDILVDLAGYTRDNRLPVFARQPAPVQVSWIGYPNTSGLRSIQYRFTDAIADPPGPTDRLHIEKLVRLPTGFLNFFPPSESPDVGSLPFISNKSVTFGSFNNLAKITPEVIAVWSRVLLAVPGSSLLMKRSSLRDVATVQRYLGMFVENGIDSGRIDLIPSTVTHTEHMRIYNSVDIALDSFPYNGTTTTCEALWMGVPVIVLAGEQHAGRVGMSILHSVGLDEYIAGNEDEYIEKAIKLSGDIEKLAQLRSFLRDRMAVSPLCNSSGFCLSLENAYREMWKNWCQIAGCENKGRLTVPKNMEGSRKLHIGGITRKKGWENFNALPDVTVDHLGDAADLSRFEDNTFKDIYASHVLEHFEYQFQLKPVLAEWLRVLASGGTLYLSVPDMDVFAEIWNKNGTTDDNRFFIMQMIFGGHKDSFDYHYSGFNEAILSQYLKEIGYVDICRVSDFGFFNDTSCMKFKGVPVSLNITARKPKIEICAI